MIAPKVSIDDSWLRRSLFHTTCMVGGKLCLVVIDSGSTENFVSNEMVDKLSLKDEKLAKPYRVA